MCLSNYLIFPAEVGDVWTSAVVLRQGEYDNSHQLYFFCLNYIISQYPQQDIGRIIGPILARLIVGLGTILPMKSSGLGWERSVICQVLISNPSHKLNRVWHKNPQTLSYLLSIFQKQGRTPATRAREPKANACHVAMASFWLQV